MRTDWLARVHEVLQPLPTEAGGVAVVLATAGPPPALALLSSGDVLVDDGEVHVGVFGTSSAVTRLGGAFSLLVPAGSVVLRVEVAEARATTEGELAHIRGSLTDIRPTSEPPWVTELRFRPSHPGVAAVPDHLAYWTEVRAWLAGEGPPPTPPQ